MLLKKLFSARSGEVVKKRLKSVLAADRSMMAPDVITRLENCVREILGAELMLPGDEIVTSAVSKRESGKTVLELTAAFAARQSA